MTRKQFSVTVTDEDFERLQSKLATYQSACAGVTFTDDSDGAVAELVKAVETFFKPERGYHGDVCRAIETQDMNDCICEWLAPIRAALARVRLDTERETK